MIYFVFETGVSRLTLNCDESKLIAGDVNKAVKLKNLKPSGQNNINKKENKISQYLTSLNKNLRFCYFYYYCNKIICVSIIFCRQNLHGFNSRNLNMPLAYRETTKNNSLLPLK